MKRISIHLATLTLVAISLLGITTIGSVSAAEYNVEGRYKRIKPARPLEQTDKVEVVDVFWYGCPHCYHFLPLLEEWEADKPDYVEFKRVPAIFTDSWAVHARAYYTARVLGVDGKLHNPVFNAIHGEKRSLNTKQELMTSFASTVSARKNSRIPSTHSRLMPWPVSRRSCRDVGGLPVRRPSS